MSTIADDIAYFTAHMEKLNAERPQCKSGEAARNVAVTEVQQVIWDLRKLLPYEREMAQQEVSR